MAEQIKYATITEVRNFTGVQTTEISDTAVTEMLKAASAIIDRKTHKYWRGQVVVTDEMYDGDGTTVLYLDKNDVRSLTALSVDHDLNGVFTTVTTSKVLLYEDLGKLMLNTAVYSNLEVTAFSKGYQNVKVSYTYGLDTSTTGTSTSVGVATLTDTGKTWTVNQWIDNILQDAGGSTYQILSNTATALTLDTTLTPAAGVYSILEKVPDEVKYVCKLIVANMMKLEEGRETQINSLLQNLAVQKATIV